MNTIPFPMTEEERIIYEWQYDLDGSFRHFIMDAISKADKDNLDKLRLGFPVHVSAYERFAHERGWFESIQSKLTLRGFHELEQEA